MLHKDGNSRERILLMGPWGSGKSRAWCSVGAWIRRTEAPGNIYVLDTDCAADRMAEEWPGFYDNTAIADVDTWEEYKKAITAFSDRAGHDDWLVVDMIDKAWEAVQNHFVQEVFGVDAASFFLESRKAGDKGHPLAEGYGINWNVINKLYSSFIGRVIRWPGHVLCCTPSEGVQRPDRSGKGGDDRDVLDLFGPYGVRPRGQKSLGFQFHTILLTQQQSDKWMYTTVKDRGREQVAKHPMGDFVMDYLVGVGGWSL